MSGEQWVKPDGAPKEVHFDEDIHIRSDTGWYKGVLNALNTQMTAGVPYTHTSNPLCERQNRVVERQKRCFSDASGYTLVLLEVL